LKPFFAQGNFVGIDEFCHLHVLPNQNEAVAVLFNLTAEPATREVTFRTEKLGLSSISSVRGVDLVNADETEATFSVVIPPMSPLLLEINRAG
jgi:hypothetical protein